MSTWLTEVEYRQGGGPTHGVTLNLAFLQEIKDDHIELWGMIAEIQQHLARPHASPREAVERLQSLQEELETYFALEEFYGYFSQSAVSNPNVSRSAMALQREHQELFLQLMDVIETTEQIVYRENQSTIQDVYGRFETFASGFEAHEKAEMELMMRFCNEELGVGD